MRAVLLLASSTAKRERRWGAAGSVTSVTTSPDPIPTARWRSPPVATAPQPAPAMRPPSSVSGENPMSSKFGVLRPSCRRGSVWSCASPYGRARIAQSTGVAVASTTAPGAGPPARQPASATAREEAPEGNAHEGPRPPPPKNPNGAFRTFISPEAPSPTHDDELPPRLPPGRPRDAARDVGPRPGRGPRVVPALRREPADRVDPRPHRLVPARIRVARPQEPI